MRSSFILLTLTILFILIIAPLCIDREKEIAYPKEINGYSLVRGIYGQDAMEELYRIHKYSEKLKQVEEATILIYRKDDEYAIVWIAITKQSKNLLEDMIDKISLGRTYYKLYGKKNLEGVDVYYGSGFEDYFYVFYIKDKVVWITISQKDEKFITSYIRILKG